MDSSYALEYRRLHEQHWWWRARLHEVLDTLTELYRDNTNARILDIGCGDALLFDELASFGEVEGVEIDAQLVSASNPWRDRITIGPFDDRYSPGKHFDTILMLDVLEHLPNPRAALQHAISLLATNGFLLITVPAFRLLWTTHDELNHHFTRYTRESFRELADGVGTIHSLRYFFHWLFPAKLAMRGKEMITHSTPRPPGIPPALVNRALYGITRVEQSMCRRLPVPFGGSLMAIMRRLSQGSANGHGEPDASGLRLMGGIVH